MSKQRSIFEDVSSDASKQEAPKGGLIDGGRGGSRLGVCRWLMVLFALVLLMIVVGGLTRLTDSGLSITEWALVKGAIPPLNDNAWDMAFDKYKNIPEFNLQNSKN